MRQVTFRKTHDSWELRQYDVLVDGVVIGELFRERWPDGQMDEWGICTGLEERFGENFASGHNRVQSVMREIKAAVKAGR